MKRRSNSLYTKKYKRRKRNALQKLAVPSRFTAPLGRAFRSVHRYFSESGIDPGAAGATAVQVFSLNGAYDPDITGVGRQPMGFDQLNQLYNDYVVTGCLFEVMMSTTETTNTNTTIVGVTVYPGATTTSDPITYCENPNTMWKLIDNRSSGNTMAKFSKYIDIGEIYGRTKDQLITEDFFKGNGAANPTDQVYLHIWGAGYGGQNGAAIAVVTRLTFYVQWFNAKLAAQS